MDSTFSPGESRCPSAQVSMRNPSVLGVVDSESSEPRIAYLVERVELSDILITLDNQIPIGKVLRLSATCETHRCTHFDGQKCRLAERLVELLPIVVEKLPACNIRNECRWYLQEGREACMRCTQVVTLTDASDEVLVHAALGQAPT